MRNNNIIIILCWIIPMFLWSNFAHASDTSSILKCEYETPIVAGCSVDLTEIAMTETYEMQFEIDYRFKCRGHRVQVGANTDHGFIPFKMGLDDWNTLSVISSRNFFIKALDEKALYRSSFDTGCSLEIRTPAKRYPSFTTLQQWKKEGTSLVEQLNNAIDALNIIRSYTDLRTLPETGLPEFRNEIWQYLDHLLIQYGYEKGICTFADAGCKSILSSDELNKQGLQREWDTLVFEKASLNSLLKIHAYVSAKIAGIPPLYRPIDMEDAFKASKEDLVRHYSLNLRKKKIIAADFINTVARWQNIINDDLKEDLDDLRHLMEP